MRDKINREQADALFKTITLGGSVNTIIQLLHRFGSSDPVKDRPTSIILQRGQTCQDKQSITHKDDR